MSPDPALVRSHLDSIMVEMKSLGLWQAEPLPEDAWDFKEAFAMDTMTFPQWLQFIFVPRVEETLETDGPWPAGSMVSAMAMREFSGWSEGSGLVSALSEFDRLFSA